MRSPILLVIFMICFRLLLYTFRCSLPFLNRASCFRFICDAKNSRYL